MRYVLTILVALAHLLHGKREQERAAHRQRRARAGSAGRPHGAARRSARCPSSRRCWPDRRRRWSSNVPCSCSARSIRRKPSRSWLQTSRSTDAAMRGEAIRSIGIGGDPKALDALAGDLQDRRCRGEAGSAAGLADRRAQGCRVPGSAERQVRRGGERSHSHARGHGRDRRAAQARRSAECVERIAGCVCDQRRSCRACARSPRAAANVPSVSRRFAGSASFESDAARAALRDIYSRSTDEEIKDAALQGMMISGDEQGVLTLYRAAKIER